MPRPRSAPPTQAPPTYVSPPTAAEPVAAVVDVPTVTDLWPGAEWNEREVFDMFGIRFDGHPDLRRILLWEAYPAHPLRKDYPLRGWREYPVYNTERTVPRVRTRWTGRGVS